MVFTIHTIILILTVFVSLNAINKRRFEDYMFVPYLVKYDNQYYRFVSHLFFHSDFTHLAFNMFSFYFIGKYLEQYFILKFGIVQGEIYFLLLYFLGGFFATLIPFIRNQDNSGYRSLGSSGAVSAVVFAFVLWNPSADLLVMFIPMKAWFFGILYLSYEIWADKKDQSNIAHDAHIGGALFGILFVLMIDINKGIEFINVFI